ncbi:hypothetical protein QTG54_011677 [Skeletonema marinoi]|uniref:HSF-type DNA-binding domain-containing protein n=1 Tax=Skeletonema marinoi TaxID=267567 RepID=A0AAD8Y0L8_9STRA|nr:hypothetical protein QTG54_011677 [Skeletonema marinoi]
MVSNEHYSHIISWMPHGRAWKVHNKKLLVDGQYFLYSYASFTRELSEWGFKMLHQAGPDYGCYYHECFLRGHPQLTALMKKTAEPDFYYCSKPTAERARRALEANDEPPNRDID